MFHSVLFSVTRQQIQVWRNEEQMLVYSISVDPADWRMIDIYAEFLYKAGREDEASRYIFLSRMYSPPPEQGIKSYLHHAKLHVMQNDLATACDMYDELYNRLLEEEQINGMLWNNVVSYRWGCTIPLSTPPPGNL